ncbi:hypothetical protein ACTL31_07855 [Leuconostoc mesenteroides]
MNVNFNTLNTYELETIVGGGSDNIWRLVGYGLGYVAGGGENAAILRRRNHAYFGTIN